MKSVNKKSRRLLYLEATSGVSGDMLLGAWIDLGVPVEVLQKAWSQIPLDNYEVEVFQTQKSGLRAIRCSVGTSEQEGPRSWKEYKKLILSSSLDPSIRKTTLDLCKQLFEVEGEFHKTPLEKLNLHEMGGSDLLLDVVGTLAAVEFLKPDAIYCSAINTGKGFIRFSHGTYPVPAPATAKLLEGLPVFQNEVEGELATPTGVLLVKHLASSFGDMPPMRLEKIGIGAGGKDTGDRPNVLRIFSGIAESTVPEEEVYLLESNLDDSSPQLMAHFMERAFEHGALDVYFTPIFMKKNRPAIKISLLAPDSLLPDLMKILFTETTAIGLRYWKVGRQKLNRQWKQVKVGKQKIRIKESYLDDTLYNYQPEYEDCKAAARKLGRSLKQVLAEAIHAYLALKK